MFIWLCWVLVATCRIFSCSMRTLSYGMWDLDPWPGIEPQSLLWAREVLATGLPRKPLPFFLLSLQFLNLWTDSAFLGKHFLSPQNLLCNCCSTQSLALSDSLSEENAFKHALWFSFCLCITLMHHWLYTGQIVHMAAFPCLVLTTLVLFLQFSSVQSLSRVRLFATPWIAARQASLSNTNSQSLFKLMPIESMMPSSHLMLCRPLLLLPPVPPSSRVFPVNQLFAWGGKSIEVSALASVLPMHTQDWSPSGWISLQSRDSQE